ncbi:uncharacterized protein LOC116461480 isoform X1 [Hylobates moloch]|uniref:uncharacterized protein LOC116461480 isoform X1 n=1 Tax=Hylobates moloch TaxID=81572 RepID=UPI002675991E|nr:uncharacterized protein LOC116461480 isoform X1 [Hylobates moloch]
MKPSRWTPHSPGEVLNPAVSHSHLWVQRRCYADPEVNVGTRGTLSPTNASSELRGKSNDDGWQLRERPASPELPFGPCLGFKVSMDHFEPYRSASQWPLHPRPKQEKSKEPLASGGGSRSALRKESGPAGGSPAPTHRSSYSRTNPPPPSSLWILSPGLGGGCRPEHCYPLKKPVQPLQHLHLTQSKGGDLKPQRTLGGRGPGFQPSSATGSVSTLGQVVPCSGPHLQMMKGLDVPISRVASSWRRHRENGG